MISPTACGRRGSALVYASFAMLAISGFAALAVDWGRVQLTKTELQGAADAASRYGAAGLQNSLFGVSAARINAVAAVAQNTADGRTITFNPDQDMEIGVWNASTKTFTPSNDQYAINAVRVTLKCTQARNTAVPMTFLSIFGRHHTDVTATAVAAVDYSAADGGAGMGRYEYYIPATSNPWLSGAKEDTVANEDNPAKNPDYAGKAHVDKGERKNPANTTMGIGSGTNSSTNWSAWGTYSSKKSSPITAGGIEITGGTTITFDGVNGGANNFSSNVVYTADGNTDWVINNYHGNENGIADVRAPINSIIGVFLTDKRPKDKEKDYPDALDFSSESARDFASIAPKIHQPFFIGDGRTSAGEVQQFIVPEGATRLFIGTMDGWEWNNNVGGFNLTAHAKGRIMTVK